MAYIKAGEQMIRILYMYKNYMLDLNVMDFTQNVKYFNVRKYLIFRIFLLF